MSEAVIKMHKRQGDALNYLINEPNIREVLYGGAKGGGKSFLGAYWLISSALIYAETSWFVARENLTDLRKHTIPTFFEVIKLLKLIPDSYKFNGQDNIFSFDNKSRIVFVSATHLPSDPMFERFGSMQNTGGWIEEGGEINENAYANLKLSIGRCNNEKYNLPFKLLITANPKKNWMYNDFIKTITPDKKYIQAFAKDNHYLPTQYHETLEGIKDKRDRQRLLLGIWDYDDDDNSLIDYNNIINTFTNTFVPEGDMFISSDIAISNDRFTVFVWSGLRIKEVVSIKNISKPVETLVNNITTNVTDYTPLLNEFKRLSEKWKVPRSNIVFDAAGIGKNVKEYLSGAVPLYSGMKAVHPDYNSINAELHYKLAEVINNNDLYFDCYLEPELKERIITQLQCIKRSNDVGEKLKIVPKAETKKIIGQSPDEADALAYRMLFLITRRK